MYIRCLECQSSTWLESLDRDSDSPSVGCQNCGREYDLEIPEDLTGSQRDQYQRALTFAESNGIDLPGAYSVLLGIMTLDQARGLRDKPVEATAKTATPRTAEARRSRSDSAATSPMRAARNRPRESHAVERPMPAFAAELPYDPGFRPAVEAGLLTAKQAIERGNRRLMAARLGQTHRLPMRVAYKIADNRITLRTVLKNRKAAGPPEEKARGKPITRKQQTAIAVVGGLIVMGVMIGGIGLWEQHAEQARKLEKMTSIAAESDARERERNETEPPPRRPRLDLAEVQTDDAGRVLTVMAPDPTLVLIKFCASAPESAQCEPVELTPTTPPFSGTRLGVFRDFKRLDSLYAIRIRKDKLSRLWVAGDGRNPIHSFEAPLQPPDAERIPITFR